MTSTNVTAELAELRADREALVRVVNQLTLENRQLRQEPTAPGRCPSPTRAAAPTCEVRAPGDNSYGYVSEGRYPQIQLKEDPGSVEVDGHRGHS